MNAAGKPTKRQSGARRYLISGGCRCNSPNVVGLAVSCVLFRQPGCQPDQADRALKQAIRANPNLVIVHIRMGVYYGRLHLDEQGMEVRLKALNLVPDFAAAFHGIGLAYARLGRFPEAVIAYREAIRIKPDYAEAYSNLAVAYHSQNKWGKAMQCARAAVRLDSENAEAHFNLGVCFLKMGDRERSPERNERSEKAGISASSLN